MPLQCAFREGNRRCRKNGTGNPALCGTHRLVVAQDHDRATQEAAAVIEGVQHFVRDPIGTLNKFFSGLAPTPNTNEPIPRPSKPPRPRPAPTPPAPPAEDPRTILCFDAKTKLTEQAIKDRRRKLAAFAHPDAGGSAKAMQRINDAAAQLLKELKNG